MRRFPHRLLVFAALCGASLSISALEGPRLGKPVTTSEIEAIAIHIYPDGTGLPEGSGHSPEGEKLYQSLCANCHGPQGTGGSADELVGKSPLNGPHPDRSIGNYWPYATTLFDFIRRSMPLNAPRSLSNDQVYALTAYLLEINGIITKDTLINKETLPAVRMPNREGFISLWPQVKY